VQTQLTLVQATPAAATALVLLEFAPAQAATQEATALLVSVLVAHEATALLCTKPLLVQPVERRLSGGWTVLLVLCVCSWTPC
jgi:hypothetical protein